MTVSLPAGPSFLRATETVGRSGPESAPLLVRTISWNAKVNTCQGRKKQKSRAKIVPTMYLENAQMCLIVGTLLPNTSVDLDVYFNVSGQRQSRCVILVKRRSSLRKAATSFS